MPTPRPHPTDLLEPRAGSASPRETSGPPVFIRTPDNAAVTTPPRKPAVRVPCGPAVIFYRLVCRLACKEDPLTGEPRGYAFAFCKWYAAQSGRSVRTVYEWVRQLREAGWIETQLDEGVRLLIRPLMPVAPPRFAASPRPKTPFTRPLLADAGADGNGGAASGAVAGDGTRVTSNRRSPASGTGRGAAGVVGTGYHAVPAGTVSGASTGPEAVPTIAGVIAGVVAGVPARVYPLSTVDTEEKKHRETVGLLPATATAEPPVVVLMRQCGITEESVSRYRAEIAPAALEDACRYTLRRLAKGLNGGAGYAISIARNIGTGTWSFPGWYLCEIGTAERHGEREGAAANKSLKRQAPATPKLPIPADWLPGVPEGEARALLREAFAAIKNGSGYAPDPASDVLRDQARRFWQKQNRGKVVPWE